MKKVCATGIAALVVAVVMSGSTAWSALTVNWGSDNLQDWDPTVQSGWLVAMYVDDDSGGINYGAGFSIGVGGIAWDGDSADSLAGSPFETTLTSGRSGGATWSLNSLDGSGVAGQNVYTVLFNVGSLANVVIGTQYVVLDAGLSTTPMQLDGPQSYSLSAAGVSDNWHTVVPEPSSIGLLAIGLVALGVKKFRKNK